MSTRTPGLIALALTLVAGTALLAFAACGGGDDNKSSTTATGSAHNSNTQTSNPGSTKTEQATGGATNTTGATTDVLSQLQSLGGDIKQAKGKATYKSTSESGTVSSFTYYSNPPKSRFDTVEADTTNSIIETPSATYNCDSSSQTCVQYAGGSSGIGLGFGVLFSSTYVDALVASAEAQGIDVSKTSENIGGVDASCFSGSGADGIGKFCFTNDGLLVYEEFSGSSGTFKLEATNVSSDVSDSDFEPLYPVTTTITLPQ